MKTKVCNKCGVEKPTTEYYTQREGGYAWPMCKCKECIKEERRERLKTEGEHVNSLRRSRYKKDPEKFIARSTEYLRKKPAASRLRSKIHRAIRIGIERPDVEAIIGCTISEIRARFESQFSPGMTWENWSRTGWHIDHIKPCCKFNLDTIEGVKECFHHSNLRPLWSKDNLKKGIHE